MEYLYDPGSGSQIFFVRRQFQKSARTAPVKQAVKELLVAVDKGVEFMGKCEHDMEIWRVDHFSPALIDPDLLIDCLAVRTMPVATGIIMDGGISTVRAATYIIAQGTGFAGKDIR